MEEYELYKSSCDENPKPVKMSVNFNNKKGIKNNNIKKVNIICPICESKKRIDVPESIINQAKQLTTISIPSGLCCEHSFQVFLDKQFKVRGYQKVDLDLSTSLIEKSQGALKQSNDFKSIKEDKNSIKASENVRKDKNKIEIIYAKFWKFIDDDNYEFRELILKDPRRKTKNN